MGGHIESALHEYEGNMAFLKGCRYWDLNKR
jgi:hypothetical protein